MLARLLRGGTIEFGEPSRPVTTLQLEDASVWTGHNFVPGSAKDVVNAMNEAVAHYVNLEVLKARAVLAERGPQKVVIELRGALVQE